PLRQPPRLPRRLLPVAARLPRDGPARAPLDGGLGADPALRPAGHAPVPAGRSAPAPRHDSRDGAAAPPRSPARLPLLPRGRPPSARRRPGRLHAPALREAGPALPGRDAVV